MGATTIRSTTIGLSALAAAFVVVAIAAGSATGTATVTVPERRFPVRHETLTLVDRSRPTKDPTTDPATNRSAPSRTLVTEVYVPRGHGPFPLVLLAHGFNGDPKKMSELQKAWASAGYVTAAPAFPLTNDLSGGPSIASDYLDQPQDMSFVLDQMLRASRRSGSMLSGRIDAQHIGAAGFSLGGGTVYGLAFNPCCRDRRIDAVVLMDAIRVPFGPPFHIRGPVMFIHIRHDLAVEYSQSTTSYAEASAPKLLMTLEQGVHFEPFENAASPHDLAVQRATTRFWDVYLRHRGTIRSIVRAGTESGLSSVVATR